MILRPRLCSSLLYLLCVFLGIGDSVIIDRWNFPHNRGKKMRAVIFSLMLVLTSMVQAGAYVGTQAATLGDDDLSFNVINAVAGYEFNNVISVRGRYAVASNDDDLDGVKVELDKAYGADLIITIPSDNGLNPYFLVGRTNIEITGSYGGYSESEDDGFTTLGAGLNYAINESALLSVEYLHMENDVESLGAGISLRF